MTASVQQNRKVSFKLDLSGVHSSSSACPGTPVRTREQKFYQAAKQTRSPEKSMLPDNNQGAAGYPSSRFCDREPSLQHRRIVPYQLNHNTQRTDPISFVEATGSTNQEPPPIPRLALTSDGTSTSGAEVTNQDGAGPPRVAREPALQRKIRVAYYLNHNTVVTRTLGASSMTCAVEMSSPRSKKKDFFVAKQAQRARDELAFKVIMMEARTQPPFVSENPTKPTRYH